MIATLLYKDIPYIRESFFPQNGSVVTINGASVSKSYSVGSALTLDYGASQTKTSQNKKRMGLMLPSHRLESCLKVNEATLSLTLINESSSKLAKENEGEFTSTISTTTENVYIDLSSYDIDLTKVESNDWCTSYSTLAAATTITDGSSADVCGITFDSVRQGFDFVMPKIASPTCTDSDPGIWSYWLSPKTTLD